MPNPLAVGARAWLALAVVACSTLGAPAPAQAGAYRAALCNPHLGAGHADAAFQRTTRHYRSETSCGIGGRGLGVSHHAWGTRAGGWGAWTVEPPSGTAISRLSLKARGRASGGHVPELLVGRSAGLIRFATPTRRPRWYGWSGAPTRAFAARLRCRRWFGCGRGRGARVRIKRLALILHDRIDPNVWLGGSLFAPGTRRGIETVAPSATDVGGGVRRFLLQVDGEPVSGQAVHCHLANGTATRLRPCPGRASGGFTAATASSPFRQGPNLVRVCATDYAATTAANRACADRWVRVDNMCPISEVARGATLRARLVRHRAGAIVAGRLLDESGRGVPGARVCVATRVALAGAVERVAVAPFTGARGGFRARIAGRPSRDVRVAYWPGATAALERYLQLDVRVRPHLRLRPRHPIRNGDRIRFETRLPGPSPGRRWVRIEVRVGRRWLPLRQGLTRAHGVFRARYRFHATTGRRTYAFRAAVPKQAGYPYEAGRSKVRRATVIG